jgi:hypothetical protein
MACALEDGEDMVLALKAMGCKMDLLDKVNVLHVLKIVYSKLELKQFPKLYHSNSGPHLDFWT